MLGELHVLLCALLDAVRLTIGMAHTNCNKFLINNSILRPMIALKKNIDIGNINKMYGRYIEGFKL